LDKKNNPYFTKKSIPRKNAQKEKKISKSRIGEKKKSIFPVPITHPVAKVPWEDTRKPGIFTVKSPVAWKRLVAEEESALDLFPRNFRLGGERD